MPQIEVFQVLCDERGEIFYKDFELVEYVRTLLLRARAYKPVDHKDNFNVIRIYFLLEASFFIRQS